MLRRLGLGLGLGLGTSMEFDWGVFYLEVSRTDGWAWLLYLLCMFDHRIMMGLRSIIDSTTNENYLSTHTCIQIQIHWIKLSSFSSSRLLHPVVPDALFPRGLTFFRIEYYYYHCQERMQIYLTSYNNSSKHSIPKRTMGSSCSSSLAAFPFLTPSYLPFFLLPHASTC